MILSAVPFVMVLRCLRPIIKVRIGELSSALIGHFAANTEVYLCERDYGFFGKGYVDVFYHQNQKSNHQLAEMWGRAINVYPYAKWVKRANDLIPGGRSMMIPWRSDQYRDVNGLLDQVPPHLSFTDVEEAKGADALIGMGLPFDGSFVCIHARDSLYRKTMFPKGDYHRHDFRDSKIEDLMMAAEELTKLGYYVIRMGAWVEQPLNSENPMILDYATKFRTDFLDIYLSAKCKWWLGSTTGIACIPMIFRKPIAWYDAVPLEYCHSWSAHDIFIPKKIWSSSEGRLLRFDELINTKAGRYLETDQYHQDGLQVLSNTPTEIAELAIEMDSRLKGAWQTSPLDDALQERFWSLFQGSELHKVYRSRIGSEFLRSNQGLIG